MMTTTISERVALLLTIWVELNKSLDDMSPLSDEWDAAYEERENISDLLRASYHRKIKWNEELKQFELVDLM